MQGELPQFIDPLRLSETRSRLSGRLPLARMRRLVPMLSGHGEAVEVTAEFGIDEQGIHTARVRTAAEFEMICQRCMQPVGVPIAIDTMLAIVSSEAEAERLSRYEPLMVGAEPTSLAAVIEDEFLLRVPMIPRHEGEPECIGPATNAQPEEPHRDNPFAVLSKLRRTNDD